MPIYEFVCQKCGKKTEVIQSHSDKHPTACPHCGGRLKKAFSAPAIQFKGSGWYVTDYGKGGAGPTKPEAAESSSEKGEGKAEKGEKSGKTETKDAAAPKSDSAGSASASGASSDSAGSGSSKKSEVAKKEGKKRRE